MNENKKWYYYIYPALVAVLIHWLILYVAYAASQTVAGEAVSGFWQAVFERTAEAGDVPHYVNIAENWYQNSGEHANDIVFFPLYPVLMKVMYLLCRNYVLAGILVSNLCLVVGSIYLFRLLEEEYDQKRAWEGVLLLTLFPVGFFMTGAYTESLFVMLMVMFLYYLRKGKWIFVGILGMLAALSRSQGIVLLVPAVYEMFLLFRDRGKRTWKAAALLFIPAGTGIYLLMNKVIYGSFTQFLDFQAAPPWYNTSHWISENLAQHYSMALQYPYLGIFIYWAQLFLYFAAVILLFYGLRKGVRSSYVALGGAYLFVTFLHGWMISGPRYMMSCIPLFIILAAPEQAGLRRGIMIVSGMLAVPFALWYMQGQAIM